MSSRTSRFSPREFVYLAPWIILVVGIAISYVIFDHIQKLDKDKAYLHDGFEITQTHHAILQRLSLIESHLAGISGLFIGSNNVDADEWERFMQTIREPNSRQASLMNTMVKGVYFFRQGNAFDANSCNADFSFTSYSYLHPALPCTLLNEHVSNLKAGRYKSALLRPSNGSEHSSEKTWYVAPIVHRTAKRTHLVSGWLLFLIDNSILFEPLGAEVGKNIRLDVYLAKGAQLYDIYNYGYQPSDNKNTSPYLYLHKTDNPLHTSEPPTDMRVYPHLDSVTYLHNKNMMLEAKLYLGDVKFIAKIWRPLSTGAYPLLAASVSLVITLFIATFIWMQLRVRKRAELLAREITQELSLNESRLRAAIDGSNDGMWDYDVATKETWYSPRWYTMLGYEDQELPAGQDTFDMLVHPDDLAKTYETINAHFEAGTPYDIKFRMRHKSGEYLWIRSRGFLKVKDGKVVRASGIHSDITQDTEYAQTLERARHAAESASQAKAEFVANMSHEIRTPLNGIVGVIELLQGTTLTPKQHQYVDILEASSIALFDIVNEVLDFSKIEAGLMKIDRVGFNLVQTATEAIEVVQQYARKKQGVEIILRVSPDLPQRFICDPARIRQCLLNLMSNAIKFTHQGTVLLDIDGTKRDDGGYDILMKVKDTGIGIPTEKLDAIFQQFIQADSSTTREYGGTGLGLAIVKTIVEMLDGTISVESTPGAGSCFTITMPMALDPQQQHTLDLKDVSALRGQRILVVDDNTINLTIFEEILLHAGMAVTTADGPIAALERIAESLEKNQPYQFALIDFNMPNMNGKKLLETLRARHANLSTLFILSASSMQRGDGPRMRELGFKGYLQKPITRDLLLSSLLAVQKLVAQGEEQVFVSRHTINEVSRNTMQLLNKEPTNANLRILIVEDNATNQQVLSWILEDAGYEHSIVANSQEALDTLTSDPHFNLVLMDCQMPVMDGFAATRAIREMAGPISAIPIFALTANASKEDEEKAKQVGMNAFLTKPVDLKKLYSALETLNLSTPSLARQQAPTPAAPAAVVLESARLLELTGNSRERMQRFFDLFKNTFDGELQNMRDALSISDVAALVRHAHTLKGAAANLHAMQIQQSAHAIELQAKSGEMSGVTNEFDRLVYAFEAFEAAYGALMKSLTN